MNYISNIMIPLIVIVVIISGLKNKVDIYNAFTAGVKEGMKMVGSIFPNILAMILAVNILLNSNFIIDISNYLEPVFKFLKIPVEIVPLGLLRPVSGSASLVIMDNLLKTYGADSFIGRIASVIQGSTDTTIYIISLYFGTIGIKKIRYSLIVGLLADLACIILAIVFVNLLF